MCDTLGRLTKEHCHTGKVSQSVRLRRSGAYTCWKFAAEIASFSGLGKKRSHAGQIRGRFTNGRFSAVNGTDKQRPHKGYT